jgi:hypothetical protein
MLPVYLPDVLIIYFKFEKKSSDNQHRAILIEGWLKIAGIYKKF